MTCYPFRVRFRAALAYKLSATLGYRVSLTKPPPEGTPVRARWLRVCALAVLACLAGFGGLLAVAMALYPGGNWLDRSAVGHRFFANFFCDLTQPVSLSGVRNQLGAHCAQLGMLCFAAALAGFFWLVPCRFVAGSRASRWVRGLGVCAVVCFIAVPLTPSERFGNWHALLALVSGGFGIGAAAWAVQALLVAERRTLAGLGAAALALGAFHAALFVLYLGCAAPPPLIVPAAQKVAALLLCAWIAALSLSILREPGLGRDRAKERASRV
jgi:hypothetical protein